MSHGTRGNESMGAVDGVVAAVNVVVAAA